jgi:hypothetical protein
MKLIRSIDASETGGDHHEHSGKKRVKVRVKKKGSSSQASSFISKTLSGSGGSASGLSAGGSSRSSRSGHGESRSSGHGHHSHHHHHHKKAGKRLRRYLIILNITLVLYVGYALFYFIMLRYCGNRLTCFLDTQSNSLIMLFAFFAFLIHDIVALLTFMKHRKSESRRMIVHQIVAIVATIIGVLLILFSGTTALFELFSNIQAQA